MRKVKRYNEFGPKSTHTIDELNDALIRYSQYNDLGTISSILRRGANINYQNSNGETALMIASARGNYKVVYILIKGVGELLNMKRIEGADLNIKNNKLFGMTALMYAASAGQIDIIADLVNGGADLTIKSNDGRTFFDFMSWPASNKMENIYYQKIILDKNPEMYHELMKHKIKIHPDILNDPKYQHLATGYDLNLL